MPTRERDTPLLPSMTHDACSHSNRRIEECKGFAPIFKIFLLGWAKVLAMKRSEVRLRPPGMLAKCALTLVVLMAGADPIDLSRTLEEGSTRTYTVSALDKERGASLEGKLTIKALSATKAGKTSIQVTGRSSMTGPNGDTQEDEFDVKTSVDLRGMPEELSVESNQVVATLLCLAGYVPGKPVDIGKEFDIDWKSGEKSLTGKGTLTLIEEKDGVKIATVKQKSTFKPGDDAPGELELVSLIEAKTGVLISCSGKVVIEGQATLEVNIKANR